MSQEYALKAISFGQPGIYFAYGERRAEIFSLAEEGFKILKDPKILDIDFKHPIPELVDNVKKQFKDVYGVEVDQGDYLNAKEQYSPEAFFMMISEILLSVDFEQENKVMLVNVPEDIFRKDLVAYIENREAKDFRFFMNFLGYLVGTSFKNLSIFVSLQSTYTVLFNKKNIPSQWKIQSIFLL